MNSTIHYDTLLEVDFPPFTLKQRRYSDINRLQETDITPKHNLRETMNTSQF